jgi:hypothetical protein
VFEMQGNVGKQVAEQRIGTGGGAAQGGGDAVAAGIRNGPTRHQELD